MKKTYISPELVVVRLAMHNIIASSPDVRINTSGNVDAASVDTKGISDVNLWDNEW